MRNSYIAKGAEALNLHNGTQTAIVVAMKVQPTFRNNQLIIGKWNYGKGVDDKPYWREYIKWQAPYKLGQEVYVRETWWSGFELDEKDCVDEDKPLTIYKADTSDPRPFDVSDDWCTHEYGHDKRDWLRWKSAATMSKSAARTRFKIVSCEAVRVKEITLGNIIKVLGLATIYTENSVVVLGNWQSYIISRFGQSAWDENHFIWYYKIENI